LRLLLLAAGAALVLAGPAIADTRPTAPVITSQDAFATALAEVDASLKTGDRTHAREILERAWRSPAFAEAQPEMRQAVLLLVTSLAAEARDWTVAKTAIIPASEMPISDALVWAARLEVATYGRDPEDAVHALTVIAQRFPAALANLSDEGIAQTQYKAPNLPDGPAKAFALTDALFKARWTPQDPFTDLSDTRMTYARDLIQRGRLDEARIQARAVTDPEALIVMRADKRFDALGATDRPSPKAGAVARQAQVEGLLVKHGALLGGQVAKAEALLALHRPQAALDTLDAALARATAAADAFPDQDDKLAWAHNVRNQALTALGRRDEALEALAAGARMPEHGQQNVNQTLNLALAQMRGAQPKAALATVASVRLDRMSPYGRAVALQARTCAHAALNDRDAGHAALKDLRAIGDEAKGNTLEALLCLGDLDEAAAMVIERLKSETLRSGVLLMLQVGPLPDFPSAFDRDHEAKLDALRARADVLAAVEPVGRILTYRPEDLWPTP
jgi:tetratricopeptide (TPR) repeat protein